MPWRFLFIPARFPPEGDPLQLNDGPSACTQDDRAGPSCEIDPICFGVVKSPAALQASASLLFLQPGSGNLTYATLVNPFPFPSPHWRDQAVSPSFTPAFNVGLRDDLGGGGDIRLDWTHLNASDSGSAFSQNPYVAGTIAGPASIQALGPPFLIGPPLPFASATGVAHFDYDAVNLEAGLCLTVGGHVRLRPFAGLQGARIGQSLSGNFLSVDHSMGFIDVSRSVFTGAGPRLGMELHYVAGNLDLLGGIAGAALIGQRQSSIDFLTSSPMNTAIGLIPNTQFFASPGSTQVIPCLDARLEAAIRFPWVNVRCSGVKPAIRRRYTSMPSINSVSPK